MISIRLPSSVSPASILRMSAAFRSPLLFCFDGTSIFTVVAAVAFEIGGGFPWSRGSSAISEII